MIPAARSPSEAAATPKNSEKTTICRISLLAIASTALFGTRCVTKSFNDSEAALRLVDALASGSGRLGVSPDHRTLPHIRPSPHPATPPLSHHHPPLPPPLPA